MESDRAVSLNRPVNEYWRAPGVSKRPHRGRFEALQVSVEDEFEKAAERAELFAMCISLIDPDFCGASMPTDYVTPGGLSYQDAALQCLMGGCRVPLKEISGHAWMNAQHDQRRSVELFDELIAKVRR